MGMKTVFLTSHFVRWQVSESITGNAPLFFLIEKSEVTALTGTFNVAEAMNAFLKRFSIEGPDRKVCGLFGYTAFDAVRYFENIR